MPPFLFPAAVRVGAHVAAHMVHGVAVLILRGVAKAQINRVARANIARAFRIGVEFDTSYFDRGMHQLMTELPNVVAAAINRTAFEIRDAEQAAVRSGFTFAGSSTEAFLSGRGAFAFTPAKPHSPEAVFFARPKTETILAPHVFGDVLTPSSARRLVVSGKLATPVSARRGARGRVRKSRLPAFVSRSGRAVVEVTRGRRRRYRVRFALSQTARLPNRLDFFGVAQRTAERAFPEKFKREWEKMVARIGR